MATLIKKDLWNLVLDQPFVAPADLAEAIEQQIDHDDLDYRSRLLIRDSLMALEGYWGSPRLEAWLKESPHRVRIEAIRGEVFERPGFPFVREQLMEPTRPETIRAMLREIGVELQKPLTVSLAGAGSLILQSLLSRRTQDLDLVDEVPKEIRNLGDKLRAIEKLHRLEFGHVQQQHYLPSGWAQRVHSQAAFGRLQVHLVDGYDIFLSKLSSRREKDKQDLKALKTVLDKESLTQRLMETCKGFLAVADLREQMDKNWYVLYGENLPA